MIQILTMPCVVFSQKSQLKQGDIYFEAGKYAEAIQSYNNYKKINKKPDALIKRALHISKLTIRMHASLIWHLRIHSSPWM
ncbi:MAG: hypothetical protein IPJ39_00585 [Saprospiraceae bacterium]|nr:hypothetical protein [Saprospiraceae bacterium]